MNVKKVILLVTDDTTPYSSTSDTQTVIFELKFVSYKLFHWFQYNHLKDNDEKYLSLLSSKTPTDVSVSDASLTTSTQKKRYLES